MTVSKVVRNLSIALLLSSPASAVSFAQQATPPAQRMEPGPRREILEQRLRERTGDLVRRRLQLTPEQMTKLQAANRQFEQQRGALLTRERDVRRELRQQLTSGTADQNRVGALLDETMRLERQRLDLAQNEQRELAKFLTPVQRAKLFGLQNEMRRRAQELRNRPPGRPGPGAQRGPIRPPL